MGRAELFYEAAEYAGFLRLLDDVKRELPFVLYAYCLMPNHLHLLVRVDEKPLSLIMQRLLGTYSLRFNTRHNRVGHVFQGRYKAIPCTENAYFYALLRYIHLNPVEAKLADEPGAWPWSSHRQYLRGESGIADAEKGLAHFHEEPGCARSLYAEFLQSSTPAPPVGESETREEWSRAALKRLAEEIAALFGISLDMLCGSSRMPGLAAIRRAFVRRAMGIGVRAVQIAQFLGVSQAAVSQLKSGA